MARATGEESVIIKHCSLPGSDPPAVATNAPDVIQSSVGNTGVHVFFFSLFEAGGKAQKHNVVCKRMHPSVM